MPSRDPNDLHPELLERYVWMLDRWYELYPGQPVPFLTCTHRPASEQQALVDAGRSRAKPMRSLHNFVPALAFDVTFDPDPSDGVGNDVTWLFSLYEKWGELAESVGLVWGGRWKHLVDGPHVQWPTTWQVAQAGVLPPLPPLPGAEHENPLLPVDVLHVTRSSGSVETVQLDRARPARVVGRKLFANEAS